MILCVNGRGSTLRLRGPAGQDERRERACSLDEEYDDDDDIDRKVSVCVSV